MSYRDLIAWKKGMQLVGAIYDATDAFPQHEIYGLASQLRCAAVSIPSNIAEGQAHYTNREFIRFLRHARGSLAEIETPILISKGRGYLREEQADKLIGQAGELGRVLSGLINSMKKLEDDRG